MNHNQILAASGGSTRREFIKQTVTVAALAATVHRLVLPVYGQNQSARLTLLMDAGDPVVQQPPVSWAANQLREALKARGAAVVSADRIDQAPADSECLVVGSRASVIARQVLDSTGATLPAAPEALGLVRGKTGSRSVLLACGSDVRGLVYGLLELADQVTHSPAPLDALRGLDRVIEQPANPIRSITRAFTSVVEDKPWFYDKTFWTRYLTELAAQRFNRFSFALGLGYNSSVNVRDSYFYFAYPFLLAVPGYAVSARGLPEEERDRNLAMLRWISDQTAARGLHFQLAIWSHAYQFRNSPNVNYPIEGLTPETHGPYCREALTALLKVCPAISGVTLRCHSESGIPQGSYDFWPMVFDGVGRCGRRVEIDLHSKSIEHKLIAMALKTGQFSRPLSVYNKPRMLHTALSTLRAWTASFYSWRPLDFVRNKSLTICLGGWS